MEVARHSTALILKVVSLVSTHTYGVVSLLEDVLDVLLSLQLIHLVGVTLFSTPIYLRMTAF